MPNIRAMGQSNSLTPNAKKAFNYLKLAFIKAPILRHFDLESHIQIKTDVSRYTIGRVLSQLNLNSNASPNDLNKSDFCQWHLVAYFSRKMIPVETQYKTHNAELLAIVKVFKTWYHYLEGCKHKILILTNYNNFRRFIDTKSLSFCQVKQAQELLKYYFQINYCQNKANRAADALSHFSRRSLNKEKKLRAKNTQIFYYLQSSFTRASISVLSLGSNNFFMLYRVLICDIYVLPQLRHF